MGIRGLQTYIENYCPPDCFSKVSIKQLVEDFRDETGEANPKIVFDGPSTMRFIYGDLDWVSGGQVKEFFENIKNFVNAFRKLGVEPVFFFGGYAEITDRKTWFTRCHDKLRNVYKVFDSLAKGTLTSDLAPFLYIMPTNTGFSHSFQQITGCEVVKSLYENDAEIAHYARQNNCMAVFGQDSEFIIYKSVKHYLSAKHFNMATMETRNYSRKKFAHSLGLHTSQLPLFASLAGNFQVSFKDLRDFHSSLCKSQNVRFETLFPAIAEYIQALPSGGALFDVLPKVAQDALRNPSNSSVIAASIRSYLLTPKSIIPASVCDYPEWSEILEKAEMLHRTNINSAVAFKILLGEEYGSSTGFEDFRRKDLPPTSKILRPLRQKFYGIILKEKPTGLEPHVVQEWSMEGYKSLDKPFLVKPIPPSVHHPGLLALWSDDRSDHMQDIRWRLFANSLSPRLSVGALRDLPDHLVLPVSTLFYLVDHEALEQWEIEALLAVAVVLQSESVERLANLPSDPVNLRAVRIATLYNRTLTAVKRLLSVCGYPFSLSKTYSYPYFDGKLFQDKYRDGKTGVSQDILFEDQTYHLPQFQNARKILFQNINRSSGDQND